MLKFKWHILFLFFALLLLHACKGDDDFISENPSENSLGSCDMNLGDFNLLDDSFSASTYNGKNTVVFENEHGEIAEFVVSEKNILNQDGLFYDYNVMTDGDTLAYCYTEQRKQFILTCESLDLEFEVNIEVKPYFADLQKMQVADVLNIFYTDNTVEPARFVLIFRKTLDIRSYPVPLYTNNSVFETLDFLGTNFNAVEKTNYNSPSLTLHFNETEGIIAFENNTLGLWVFSHKK